MVKKYFLLRKYMILMINKVLINKEKRYPGKYSDRACLSDYLSLFPICLNPTVKNALTCISANQGVTVS